MTSTVRCGFALVCGLLLAGCAGSGKTASATPGRGGPATEIQLPEQLSLTLEASAPFTPTIDRFGHDAKTPRSAGDVVSFSASAAVSAGSQIVVEVRGTGWKVPLSKTADREYTGSGRVPADVAPGVYGVQARMLDPARTEIVSRSSGTLTIVTSCETLRTWLRDLPIQFDTDDSSLLPGAKERLNRIAGILLESQRADYALIVEGHADVRGESEYNLGLSERRALAARAFLLERGIPPSQVEIKYWGEGRPRDSGMNEKAWRTNRRAEVVLPDCDSR